jgi:hypothetical protein
MKRFPALTAAAALALLAPAAAQAGPLVASAPDCSSQSASQVFLPFADLAQYVQAPGGAAESAAGWTLSGGAAIAPGNEPWQVTAATDSSSLSLPAGATATTGTMCVGIQHPDLRFFARGSGVGTLNVSVVFETADGSVVSAPVGSVAPTSWAPTPIMPLAVSLLPLLPGSYTPVQFRFSVSGNASFSVDDVYVDPWGGR